MPGHVVRCTDAGAIVFGTRQRRLNQTVGGVAALFEELLPHVGITGHEILGHQLLLRIAEEFEIVLAAPDRFGPVFVH